MNIRKQKSKTDQELRKNTLEQLMESGVLDTGTFDNPFNEPVVPLNERKSSLLKQQSTNKPDGPSLFKNISQFFKTAAQPDIAKQLSVLKHNPS